MVTADKDRLLKEIAETMTFCAKPLPAPQSQTLPPRNLRRHRQVD